VNTRDVTDDTHAEAERREAELQYRVLVESVHAILWRGDARTFQFDFVTREAEVLLGYPVERWTTEPAFWLEHVHPDDREWTARYYRVETDLLRRTSWNTGWWQPTAVWCG
jgi:PAS domain-containing protein